MSELKRHHINEVMDIHNLTRGKMGYSFVYYVDDVDRVIAHHKYRRCLAMARWCERKRIDAANYRIPREKWEFYDKWHKRWLELAEKFKPNNSTAQ